MVQGGIIFLSSFIFLAWPIYPHWMLLFCVLVYQAPPCYWVNYNLLSSWSRIIGRKKRLLIMFGTHAESFWFVNWLVELIGNFVRSSFIKLLFTSWVNVTAGKRSSWFAEDNLWYALHHLVRLYFIIPSWAWCKII
jgi:hypothetical protein